MSLIEQFRRICICTLCAALASKACHAQNVTYQGIPPGFDFPADEETLLQFRDNEDIAEMRRHAWYVFAGLTQHSSSGEAIWETWFPSSDTFRVGPAPAGPRIFQRRFTPPRQMFDPNDPQATAPGSSLMSFVLFNEESHDFIRDNSFHRHPTLNAINDGFPSNTPLADRKIEDFPREGMSLKLVWWRVEKDTITALPTWDFEPTNPDADGNDWPDWKRLVGVDPTRMNIPAGETAMLTLPANSTPREARVVSIHDFYHFEVDNSNVNDFLGMPANQQPQIGDTIILVGMHYTTKEIPDWVWATFWWHDRPDSGAYSADRPSAVSGVWRNYLMDIAYSMDTPREFDGTANSCYNPWLEARFQHGMKSNCMTCHQRAVWTPVSFLPVTQGSMAPDDPFFTNKTKLDFFWSIAFESQP